MYSILLNFVHIFLRALRVLYTVSVTGYVDCPKTTHVDTQSMTLGMWTTTGVARGAGAPLRAMKQIFLDIFVGMR